MNRDEAKEKVQILDYIETHKADYVNEKQVIEIIDFVYDDFESRTCENCTHVSDMGVCLNLESFACGRVVDVDDGCNKFERKQDETNQ